MNCQVAKAVSSLGQEIPSSKGGSRARRVGPTANDEKSHRHTHTPTHSSNKAKAKSTLKFVSDLTKAKFHAFCTYYRSSVNQGVRLCKIFS